MALRNAFGNLALDTTVTQINTSVGNVKTSVDTVNTSVGNVKTSVDTVNTSVGNVKTSVDTVNTSVGNVKTSVDTVNATLNNNPKVSPLNTTTLFREPFETYDSTNVWLQGKASTDIIQLDGNAGGASYLVISKDPLTAGTESNIETRSSFVGPFETSVGLHISQRLIGQEATIELISTDTPMTPGSDIAISSISQSTTTLTVVTVSNHGLMPGHRIGIYGITSDNRLNYTSLVVSSLISATSFTATAGPGGTIASLTVGPYTSQGFIYYRSAMSYAPDGMAQVFENATATQSSMYVRQDRGEVIPSGTINGSHSVTVATTASTALVTAPYSYAFNPSSEYKFQLQVDKASFFDIATDTTGGATTRLNRSSIVPNLNKNYKLRFRAVNEKSFSVPAAKIVSATKSASTTATIVTDVAHNLTTSDWIVIYGIRDQVNFAAQTTVVQVASIVSSTSFTVVFGASATATSYGGYIAKLNGNSSNPASGSIAIQSATITAGELLLVGSGSWTWSIGDYVNVHGCRADTTGNDMGLDGTYKVVNVSTTNLYLTPIGSTTIPSTLVTTNCGGVTIKRTDVRLSLARIFQYQRERVEFPYKGDTAASLPVVINSGTVTTVSTVTAATTVGTVNAVTTANLQYNTLVTDVANAAISSNTTTSAITPTTGAISNVYNIVVPIAPTGTTPTLDIVVQESDDSGTNWFDTYHFPRITSSGQYRSPIIPMVGNRVRYVQTLTGTTPSFARSVNRLQSHSTGPIHRQFFDRTINSNTLNSTTPSWFTEGTVDFNVVVSMGAITTTAPIYAVEISPDNSSWFQIGANVNVSANSNVMVSSTTTLGRFTRVRVVSAGSGATLNYIMYKGIGR